MKTFRAREIFFLVMIQMRRAGGGLPLATLMTWPGPHHFGMNSIRKGSTPCSQTKGKFADSRSLGVRERTTSCGLPIERGVPTECGVTTALISFFSNTDFKLSWQRIMDATIDSSILAAWSLTASQAGFGFRVASSSGLCAFAGVGMTGVTD